MVDLLDSASAIVTLRALTTHNGIQMARTTGGYRCFRALLRVGCLHVSPAWRFTSCGTPRGSPPRKVQHLAAVLRSVAVLENLRVRPHEPPSSRGMASVTLGPCFRSFSVVRENSRAVCKRWWCCERSGPPVLVPGATGMASVPGIMVGLFLWCVAFMASIEVSLHL